MQFSVSDRVIGINIRDFDALSSEIRRRFAAREGFTLATLNLDHLVKIGSDSAFARAYARHDLVVADGNPVVALSRIAGRPVTLLPGSELIEPLARIAAEEGVSVALVGSDAPTLEAACAVLEAQVPGLRVAMRHAPEMGFDPQGDAAGEICEELAASGARLCFLALGAPKQERFAVRARGEVPEMGFVSIGAGLDFIAGKQKRAPRWVRRIAMEWLWRALGDLPRLGPRYARCFAILPRQVWNAVRLRFSDTR